MMNFHGMKSSKVAAVDESKSNKVATQSYFYRHLSVGTQLGLNESSKTRSLILNQQIDPFFASSKKPTVSARNKQGIYRISPHIGSFKSENLTEEIKKPPSDVDTKGSDITGECKVNDACIVEAVESSEDDDTKQLFRVRCSLEDINAKTVVTSILEDMRVDDA